MKTTRKSFRGEVYTPITQPGNIYTRGRKLLGDVHIIDGKVFLVKGDKSSMEYPAKSFKRIGWIDLGYQRIKKWELAA